jgi:hypothetical protein
MRVQTCSVSTFEVLRALDVDQYRLAAAVEQDVVRTEFTVDER